MFLFVFQHTFALTSSAVIYCVNLLLKVEFIYFTYLTSPERVLETVSDIWLYLNTLCFNNMCSAVLCLVAQSYLTLCDPVIYSRPGSSVHEILQARILEWVAMPPPGDPPNPGIKPRSPALQAGSLPSEPPALELYILISCSFG